MKMQFLLFLFFFSGICFGLLFKLKWYYLFFICVLSFFLYTFAKKNFLIQAKENEDFKQINAYMSQLSQSFVRTQTILSALQETLSTFPVGRLQLVVSEAIDILLLEGGDITLAERKALAHIESSYPCERLHTLHEFMLLAESRGGECKKEFVLLEKMRIAWETAVQKHHQSLIENRDSTTLLYLLMLGVCVFVLYAFPTELHIFHMEFIQVTNCILVLLLMVFFSILHQRINGQLFQKSKTFTQKKEMELAFPKWLFDLMLLMQRESVESAILHSIETAPAILQPELTTLSQLLLQYPGEIHVFISFLSEYKIPQVEMNMRKLYALSVGADNKEESVSFLIEANMDSLMKAEEKSYELKSGFSTLFQFLPLLVVSFGMLIYCVAIIIVSLAKITTLFE